MTTPLVRNRGFTLLELVVAIAISAIVVAFAGMFLKAPMDAYVASSRQADLQESISMAWPRMQADIHSALPHSARRIRNGKLELLELLPVVDSARFMAAPSGSFRTAGYFQRTPTGYFMSVDNDPTTGGDAYDPATKAMTRVANAITLAGTAADQTADEDIVQISGAVNLRSSSPNNRIYLVTKPVTYLCDENAGTLQRFSDYTIAPLQTSRNTAAKLLGAGAKVSLVAKNLTTCSFGVGAGNATASQIITIQMSANVGGETTSIYQTAAVDPLR